MACHGLWRLQSLSTCWGSGRPQLTLTPRFALQEVELKVLRWLHEEEATGVQYLEVRAKHSAEAVAMGTNRHLRLYWFLLPATSYVQAKHVTFWVFA